jgi:ABC-type polysaccharide/polyol phosphate export permease
VSTLRRSARLLKHLAWWDLVAQYFGSWVGLLWNVLLPAVVIGVYLAVFEFSPRFLFGGWDAVGGYGINLVAALLPWLLFQEGVARAAGSFVDQRHLITQVPIPAALIPLANVCSALARHVAALVIVGIILVASGIWTGAHWLGILVVLPIVLLLTAGCALLAAAGTVLNRDIAPTVQAAMLPLFFTTPVVYPPHVVPKTLRVIMDLNPLTPAVQAYRDLLVTGQWPLPGGLLWSGAVGLVLVALASVILRHLGPELAERM